LQIQTPTFQHITQLRYHERIEKTQKRVTECRNVTVKYISHFCVMLLIIPKKTT
jgi:hypothetical protein